METLIILSLLVWWPHVCLCVDPLVTHLSADEDVKMLRNAQFANADLYSVLVNLPGPQNEWSDCFVMVLSCSEHYHHNHLTALFPGPPGWAGARREPLVFMVQGKINRGRHNDHPAGHNSIRTKQCPPLSPIFTGRMPFLLLNQQCQITEGRTLSF